MLFKSLCFHCLPKVLCHLLMTCSILRLQPCWFACSAGTGNFYQDLLRNSCPESIWFHSGRLRSSTFIANGSRSRSPQKKLGNSTPRCQSRKISPTPEDRSEPRIVRVQLVVP